MIETMSRAAISRDWVGSFAAGRFPLLQWLGGSQATGVFLSELSEHSQKAVIKLIPEDDQDAAARAAAWETAASLSHPNLMKVYTHGRCEIEGVPCIYVVTEHADEVLAEILRERPLSSDETREMLGPALAALAYLHAKGLVHGRLNPSNFMAVGDNLKLTTYGVCPVGAAVISRPTRTVCDAPETENGLIVPASDIWSLGATLVEVLTKYPPDWNRAKAADPTVPQSMPEPFASFARRCLRSDPARRITISEISARLEPTKTFPLRPENVTSPSRSRIALPLAAAALVLAASGIWYALSHRAQPPQPVQQVQNVPVATPTPSPIAEPPQPAASAPSPALPSQPHAARQSAPPALQQPMPQAAPQPETQTDQGPAAAATTINPAIVNQILPDIVPSAMKTINGTLRVSVQLTVGADGSVTGASLQSPGPSKYFAGKSLEAARHWKFRPESAPSNWTLEFQYRQSGIHVVAEQTAP
ncbi:MAG: protein kinase domain-containing protein [Terracidiphilus sp.]